MISITYPYPASGLNPNRKMHHMAKYKLAQEAKNDAYYLTLEATQNIHNKETYKKATIKFYPPNKHNRDVDNAIRAFKHHQDGMCLALGIDDSQLRPQYPDHFEEPVKGGKVVVVLEAME